MKLKNLVISALLLSLLVLASCKKSEPAPPKEQSAPKQDANSPAQPMAPEANASAQQLPSASGLVPIEIKLPKPMFVGTPQNIQLPNLEAPLNKPRPAFLAPAGTTNVAMNKKVSSSFDQPISGELSMLTDGDKEGSEGSYIELGPGVQSVTIDLGKTFNIYAVVVWHFHSTARVYKDIVAQITDDSDFITDVKTIYNNDDDNSAGLGVGTDKNYIETSEGRLIDAKGTKGRYVRLYSNGNNANDLNHYIEVEVYGTEAK